MRAASLFESFNARSLDSDQVGRGFIYTPIFSEIAARNNTAIIGPRGSGKTTFLKMLTLPALHQWRGTDSARLAREIDYVSIYVPSDFTWYPDFRRAVKVEPDPDADALLSYGLFRHHVLLAICETLQHLTDEDIRDNPRLGRLAIDDDEQQASELTKMLAVGWDIELKISGIFGLKRAVTDHIKKVQYWITLASLEDLRAADLLREHPPLSANIFDDLRLFADIFEQIYQRPGRWAACFDELEIAPKPVKTQIWQSGRSFDPRFLIKLSASPFDQDLELVYGPRMPMQGHDFNYIVLADQRRSDIMTFSRRMFTGICRELSVSPADMERALGRSFFEDGDLEQPETADSLRRDNVNPYASDGFRSRILRSLAEKDKSFGDHLARRNIDLDRLDDLPEAAKAAEIRKLSPTVIVRNEFLFSAETSRRDPRARRFRSRKKIPDIYTGLRSLFAICEGNPRWLVGMLRPLLKDISEDRQALRLHSISRQRQAERIERTITTFLSLLATIPLPTKSRRVSVVNLIEEVGEFFFEQVMSEAFNPEPVLSFNVNEGVEPGMYLALGLAINQGAFVLVPEKANVSRPGKIVSRRVRLTYLLAPRYRLPLVKGRPTDLTRIIRNAKHLEDDEVVSDLFGEIK